ncbi:hypothetical protein BGX21_002400, partial [Mortierella sp. AD011]
QQQWQQYQEQWQQQQHYPAKGENEGRSDCKGNDVTQETLPNINNLLWNGKYQPELPPRNRPDHPPRPDRPPRAPRHTKMIDWRLFYKPRLHQRCGRWTQGEDEDEQETTDDSCNRLDLGPDHDKRPNVRDQEWLRDLHVRESTLILEGRHDEAISVRRIRNALRACFHIGVWAGLSHHQDPRRSHSCSRGRGRCRNLCRRGYPDHHQIHGQARAKCCVHNHNLQNWYTDSLRTRTHHIITKQKKN